MSGFPYYKTEGLILEGFELGSSDRGLIVFTRELGMIKVSAKSARKVHSKLRPLIQKFACLELTLVQGRSAFKLIGAKEIFHIYYDSLKEPERLAVVSRICSMLMRLLQGKEKDYDLYDTIKEAMNWARFLGRKHLKSFELLTVARLLYRTGYLAGDEDLREYLDSKDCSPEIVLSFWPFWNRTLTYVNRSMNNSQL